MILGGKLPSGRAFPRSGLVVRLQQPLTKLVHGVTDNGLKRLASGCVAPDAIMLLRNQLHEVKHRYAYAEISVGVLKSSEQPPLKLRICLAICVVQNHAFCLGWPFATQVIIICF